MKKENRQMAQERRAQERRRKEQKEKTKKFLMIGLPVLVVVLFIAVIIVDAVQNSNITGETASAVQCSVSIYFFSVSLKFIRSPPPQIITVSAIRLFVLSCGCAMRKHGILTAVFPVKQLLIL